MTHKELEEKVRNVVVESNCQVRCEECPFEYNTCAKRADIDKATTAILKLIDEEMQAALADRCVGVNDVAVSLWGVEAEVNRMAKVLCDEYIIIRKG